MRRVLLLCCLSALGLLVLSRTLFPAQAAPASAATPQPSPTHKVCHLCGEDVSSTSSGPSTPVPDGIVHAVMFWMEGCGHCTYVRHEILPPLQAEYGPAFDLLQVEIISRADVDLLYTLGDRLGVEHTGVPFLILGDHVLVGSEQIPEELPGLIKASLDAGGVPLPVIPELEGFSSLAEPAAHPAVAVVHILVFSTLDCSTCELTLRQAIAPLQETHAGQLEFRTVDVITAQDVDYLHQVAAGYGVSEEQVALPLVILGEHILIDQEIAAGLPALVDEYLAQGGAAYPELPPRPGAAPIAVQPAKTQVPIQEAPLRPNGFPLANTVLAVMVMVLVLVFSQIAFPLTIPWPAGSWTEWPSLGLILAGMGVAAYLAYVETQSVAAVCGPVGDCNAVQSSPYARLFGVLPVGVLGVAGYAAMLAAWLVRRFIPRLRKPAIASTFGLAGFGVTFSIYLTYLEIHVIRAVCLWCLASAGIMTLLLLLSLPQAKAAWPQWKATRIPLSDRMK